MTRHEIVRQYAAHGSYKDPTANIAVRHVTVYERRLKKTFAEIQRERTLLNRLRRNDLISDDYFVMRKAELTKKMKTIRTLP